MLLIEAADALGADFREELALHGGDCGLHRVLPRTGLDLPAVAQCG